MKTKILSNDWLKFAGAIIMAQFAGLMGSLFTFSAIPAWYATLNKPAIAPPNWIFGPVWTMLYALMGIALFLVWKKGLQNKSVKFAFWFFIVHLVVNSLWSAVFFGLKNPGLAFFVIIALWAMIVALIWRFWHINKTASWLLVPYLLWVSFASVLNFLLWKLN